MVGVVFEIIKTDQDVVYITPINSNETKEEILTHLGRDYFRVFCHKVILSNDLFELEI